MTDIDPGLIGLSPDERRRTTPEKPETGNPSSADADQQDSLVDTAEQFLSRIEETAQPADLGQAPRTPPAEEPPVRPGQDEPADLPVGAIGSANGQPFTDFEAAQYKAEQMRAQTGDDFIVQALTASRYIVVPLAESGSLHSNDEHHRNHADSANDKLGYLAVPLNDLKLSDFPDEHPVHACGLSRYKRYMKKNFRFKPAYRSMLMLLMLIVLGSLIYVFPIPLLNLLPTDVVRSMAAAVPADKLTQGVSVFGAMLAVAAAGRVLWDRHVSRYMLMPTYAKMEYGIISRHSTKILYANIVDYDTKQSILGRLLNYGTLELSSAGSDGSEIEMRNLFAPRLVECVLEGKMEEAKRKSR